MTDKKISQLTALTAANVAQDDVFAIVDTGSNETKKISMAQLQGSFKGTGSVASNVVLGDQAGNSVTSASNNVAVGRQAAFTNKTGAYNVIIGDQAGFYFDYAGGVSQNTFVGQAAGYNTTQIYNTFIGSRSGFNITTGTRNTIVGRFDGNQDSLNITTSSSNIILSDGDGNVPVYADSSSNWNVRKGNVIIGTSGKGIDFSAAGNAAGMTSELLADYEEGTWTPVPTSVTVNSGTPVWTGYYCKIGRTVTAQWTLTDGSVSVTTSSYITLPFVAPSTFRPWGPWGIPSTNSSQGGMVAFGSDLYFNTAQTFSVGSGTITYQV